MWPPCRSITAAKSRFKSGLSCNSRRLHLHPIGNLQQFIDLAQLLQLAIVEDRNPIADVLYVVQAMAAHDYRLAFFPQVQNQVLHPAGSQRIQAGGRLIQNHQLRIIDEGLGQTDALPHPLRILFQNPFLVVFQAHHGNELLSALHAVWPGSC